MSELAARCFKNDLPDYNGSFEDSSGGQRQADAFLAVVQPFLRSLVEGIIQHLSLADADESVYTGGPGVAFFFLRLSQAVTCLGPGGLSAAQCLAQAQTLLRPRTYDPSIAPSLLCGEAGHVCMTALYHHLSGRSEEAYQSVEQYTALYDKAVRDESDEWLYGRAGFVHGLLLLKQVVLKDSTARARALRTAADGAVQRVCRRMLESGRTYDHGGIPAEHQCPLMYQWYGEEYLGAAHGVLGILAQIMAARTLKMEEEEALRLAEGKKGGRNGEREEEEEARLIQGALEWCAGQQSDRTFNFPPVAFDPPGPMVHFCHGAPGAVLAYGIAHRWLCLRRARDHPRDQASGSRGGGGGVAGHGSRRSCTRAVAEDGEASDLFLQTALRAGECVWKYGLVRKGPGLCHGIGGNGQCLLALYGHTRDPTWLWRAAQFAVRASQLAAGSAGQPKGETGQQLRAETGQQLRAETGQLRGETGQQLEGKALRLDGGFVGQPDNPLSLFEGVAGTACFCLDLVTQLMAVQQQCRASAPASSVAASSSSSTPGLAPLAPGPDSEGTVPFVTRDPAFPLFELGGF